jgi:hypothetical protein
MRVTRTLWAVLAVLLVGPVHAAAQAPQATSTCRLRAAIRSSRSCACCARRSSGTAAGRPRYSSSSGISRCRTSGWAGRKRAADRLEDQAFALEQERRRIDAEIRDHTRAFEQAPDDARRKEAESRLQIRADAAERARERRRAARVRAARGRARPWPRSKRRYRELGRQGRRIERDRDRTSVPLR